MPVVLALDDSDLDHATRLAAGFGSGGFGFLVTPNVDHVIRLHDDPEFRAAYAAATWTLLDSRVLAHLLRLTGRPAPAVCTGSDLTAAILGSVAGADDKLVVVGGSPEQARHLAARYGLRNLKHHNPPMGFAARPADFEACLGFIEAESPFRFCFLAVGSPQQERVATALRQRGRARGLALCVGAALNFLTGNERRAPRWLQRLSLEWLYRLASDPARLAWRYLVRGPRVLWLLRDTEIVVRERPAC